MRKLKVRVDCRIWAECWTPLPIDAADEGTTWGRSWVYIADTRGAARVALPRRRAQHAPRRRLTVGTCIRTRRHVRRRGRHVLRTLSPNDDGYVGATPPLETPPRHRVPFSTRTTQNVPGGVRAMDVRHTTTCDGQRYFRPGTGRARLRVPGSTASTIANTGTYDRFFLYAYKGRLFFDVGEMDRRGGTLIIIGISGCGKSTVEGRAGVLSAALARHVSNMQPQFGMAAVLRDNKAHRVLQGSPGHSRCTGEWRRASGDYGRGQK